jgi:hypothetical protein
MSNCFEKRGYREYAIMIAKYSRGELNWKDLNWHGK